MSDFETYSSNTTGYVLIAIGLMSVSVLFYTIHKIFLRLLKNHGVSSKVLFVAESIVAASLLISIVLFNRYTLRLDSQMQVRIAELPRHGYLTEIRLCSVAYFDHSSVTLPTKYNAKVSVSYHGASNLVYLVSAEGRSPALALQDRGYREKLAFLIQISRDFENAKEVLAYVMLYDARQTPWPDNDQVVDDSKYGPYLDSQARALDTLVGAYATYLSECIGARTRGSWEILHEFR